MVPTLLITGTVGAGKTAVTSEISELLTEREVAHAAIDLDALTWQWPPSSPWNSDLMFENLAALWANFRHYGSERLVLARVLEDPNELRRYETAVPGAEVVVCRLVSAESLRVARLTARMPPGASLDWHLRRTVELDGILDERAAPDLVVDNGERDLRDVAEEVLRRAGWMAV